MKMTFSFNFQLESTDTETTAKTTFQNGKDDEHKKEEDTVLWKEAKEHFVEERHRNKVTISNVHNFDQFKIDSDTSLSILNSDSVTFRLRTEEYSGDLEPALLDNTDLVPGKYEVSRNGQAMFLISQTKNSEVLRSCCFRAV